MSMMVLRFCLATGVLFLHTTPQVQAEPPAVLPVPDVELVPIEPTSRRRISGAAEPLAAPIYRTLGCGEVYWMNRATWYEQLQFDHVPTTDVPLLEVRVPVCTDTCQHLVQFCDDLDPPGPCHCLAAADGPVNVSVQLYDGDPCRGGTIIPRSHADLVLPLDPADIGDGVSDCFMLTVPYAPTLTVPAEVWVEVNADHDDLWVFIGRPGIGSSPMSGYDNGVCTSYEDNEFRTCQWMFVEADAAAEVWMTLLPVDADGPHTIVGNEIILDSGGQVVTLELRISDWDPDDNGTQLQSYVITMDSASFTSGSQGVIGLYRPPCIDDSDCVATIGPRATCFLFDERCLACTFDEERDDWVFGDSSSLFACDKGAFLGAVIFPEPGADDPEPFPADGLYAGTVKFEVPPDAQGTFTIESYISSLENGVRESIPQFALIPSKITVGTPSEPDDDCNDNGVPDDLDAILADCNDNDIPDECDIADGTSQDCNTNTIPDECEDDCNNNGVADSCDILSGTSRDDDGDGVPDECDCLAARTEIQQLGAQLEGGFGQNVAFDDDWIVVGAPRHDGIDEDSGAAYVFRRDGDTWVQSSQLIPDDAAFKHFFGYSVAIHGDIILIGSRDDHAGERSGAAYTFWRDDNNTPADNSDDVWLQQDKLTAADAVSFGVVPEQWNRVPHVQRT